MHEYSAFDDKDRVRQALRIEEVIGNYLELRRQGSGYVALCPWHDDKRPSLQINPSRQSWKCWVCEIGGDIFSFIMQREHVDFRQALEILARMAGIELTRQPRKKTTAGEPNDKPTLYKAMAWVENQYHHFLLDSTEAQPARDYLASRGIQQPAVEAFRIGYVPDDYTWLLNRSQKTEFTPQVLQAVGMLKQSESSETWYDRFRGRVIFPIRDRFDRPIAMGGRVLPQIARQLESKHGNPPAKYINSPETRLYSKSDQFYGLNLMRNAIAKSRHMIVVEGYTDVIALWQAGIDNVVGVLGTALGERHLQLVRPFADRVTLVLDGDAAGQRRAGEVLELFVTADIDLRILTLPDDLDPCDFIQNQGAAEFRDRVDDAPDAIDHKIAAETGSVDLLQDTHQAHRALENILATMATSPRPLQSKTQTSLREQQLLSRLSRMFQVDIQSLNRRLSEMRKGKSRPTRPREDSPPAANSRPSLSSRDCELLQTILEAPEIFPTVFENVSIVELSDATASRIFSAMCNCHEAGHPPTFERLMTGLEDVHLKQFLIRLDEATRAKSAESRQPVDQRLAHLLESFRGSLEQRLTQSAITKLQSAHDDAEQDEMLRSLLEQTLHRQGLSAPKDG